MTATLRLGGARPPRTTLLANVLLFQAGWFACVLGAARGLWWPGPLAAALIVGWHLLQAAPARHEAALVAGVALVGALFETALLRSGWLRHDTAALPLDGVAPVWMVALWALFATTLNVSLRALRGRVALAALAGALGGPLAYAGGARLGAIEFVDAAAALAAIGIGWALLTPLLLHAARRLDGFAGP